MADVEQITWAFYGYETPAGGRLIQEWFDGLLADERDEVLDTLGYLQALPLRLWVKPEFTHLGDGLSEVRFKVNELNETVRIYGFFWPPLPKESERKPKVKYYPSYTFLHAGDKKVKNDVAGKAEALRRMGMIKRKETRVHAFKFS